MYIGLTNNLERRYNDHWSAATNPKSRDYNQPIHRALRKYGKENFEYNVLEDNINDLELLKKREQYWIKYYNTYEDRDHYNETPGGDLPGYNTAHLGEAHGRALLSEEDVKYCRQCYKEGKRSRDIWNLKYQNKIGWAGFLRMWHGKTWKHVMPEVFDHNPHRASYNAVDRDYLVNLFLQSNLGIKDFVKTPECYVGYGTLWKMINTPEFYDNK